MLCVCDQLNKKLHCDFKFNVVKFTKSLKEISSDKLHKTCELFYEILQDKMRKYQRRFNENVHIYKYKMCSNIKIHKLTN